MEKLKFSVIDRELYLPDVEEKKDGRRDFVTYGEDNLFPQYIWDLYTKSAIFESIIRGESDYVMGNGIIFNELIANAENINSDYQTLEDIIEHAILDYLLFDGFAVQIFRDKDSKIKELYNLDFQNCRVSQDGKRIVYGDNWSKYNTKTSSYPKFEIGKNQPNSIFYFKGKNAPQTKVYPIPSYIGALSDIRTSAEISNFHLHSVLNGFNPATIINLNGGDVDDETKRAVEKKFKEKFCGTDNAAKFMLNFNENQETAITVERLQDDGFDKKFEALSKTMTSNIYTAFRAQPQLFGLQNTGNVFNKEDYQQAATLYNKTVIKPIQKIIERAFSRIFGLDKAITFVPFNLDLQEGENNNE